MFLSRAREILDILEICVSVIELRFLWLYGKYFSNCQLIFFLIMKISIKLHYTQIS